MNISEFFNENNNDHLKAFVYFLENGVWPKDFITDDISFNATWHFDIAMKLALKYIKIKFDDIDKHCTCDKTIPSKNKPIRKVNGFMSF
jgi:hypothetical protein